MRMVVILCAVVMFGVIAMVLACITQLIGVHVLQVGYVLSCILCTPHRPSIPKTSDLNE